MNALRVLCPPARTASQITGAPSLFSGPPSENAERTLSLAVLKALRAMFRPGVLFAPVGGITPQHLAAYAAAGANALAFVQAWREITAPA